MGVLDRTELLLQAKNYSGSGNWLDEANSHDATILGALFLPHTGTQHMYLPGTAGNYASAPDSGALSITGDIFVQARVALDDWTPASEMAIVSKYTAVDDHRSYILAVRSGSTGLLRLYWSEDGVNLIAATSSVAPAVSNDDWLWIGTALDVDGGAGGIGRVTFYTGGSGTSPTWVQLGTTADAGSAPTSIFDGLHPVEVGAYANGSAGMLQGKVANVRIYSDLTETTLEFDADFTDRSALTEPFATFTEGSPNAATITLNRSATDHKLTIVDRAMFLLGGGDYFGIADHADLDFAGGDDFTVMAAGRFYDNTPAGNGQLINKRRSGSSEGYQLLNHTSVPIRFLIGDGPTTSIDDSPNPTNGQAFVVAGRRDTTADEVEAFLDGIGSGSPATDTTTASLANADPLLIGARTFDLDEALDGEIYAVALWREALSDADVVIAENELLARNISAMMLSGVG